MTFDEPLDWRTVALWLDSLVAIHGKQLLRIKGIVNVEGVDEPIVIHAVQHLFHPPSRLKSWPGSKRQSRIVFITDGVPRASVEEALRRAQDVGRAP
jgi:G3E family GTPase